MSFFPLGGTPHSTIWGHNKLWCLHYRSLTDITGLRTLCVFTELEIVFFGLKLRRKWHRALFALTYAHLCFNPFNRTWRNRQTLFHSPDFALSWCLSNTAAGDQMNTFLSLYQQNFVLCHFCPLAQFLSEKIPNFHQSSFKCGRLSNVHWLNDLGCMP